MGRGKKFQGHFTKRGSLLPIDCKMPGIISREKGRWKVPKGRRGAAGVLGRSGVGCGGRKVVPHSHRGRSEGSGISERDTQSKGFAERRSCSRGTVNWIRHLTLASSIYSIAL